jgi:hypothetical protein
VQFFENQKCDIQITQKQDEFNTSYVDDISLVQIGKDSLETTPILEERTRIQMERASKLGLSYSQSKSELLHCHPSSSTLKSKPIESLPVITIGASNSIYTVVPSRQIRQLGVIFDESLNFIPHARDAAAEGMKALGKICCLRHRGKGISCHVANHLVFAPILPKMLWASPVVVDRIHLILFQLFRLPTMQPLDG